MSIQLPISENLALIQYYLIHSSYSNFLNCPNNVTILFFFFFPRGSESDPGANIPFSCHISLLSFKL